MVNEMTVANTILQQLGGSRFIVMTGSRNFVGSANSLQFKVGKNEKKVTHIRITLTPADTYTVEAMAVRGVKVTPMGETDNVYCDNLQAIFTSLTGLYTRF